MSERVIIESERAFDLPPFWDGLAVTWHGWRYPVEAFICPRPRPTCCEHCGATEAQVHNRGSRYDVSRRRFMRTLFALRCVKCRTDTVWETGTDDYWTLDDSDYGPGGSSA